LLEQGCLWALATNQGAAGHLLSEKDLKKGHGSFDYVVEANSGVTVLWLFDNDLVQKVSNYVRNDLTSQAQHWSKK